MTIHDALAKFDLNRVADRLAVNAKPSIRLSGVEYAETASHRLGGRPNLPPDFRWPSHEGLPLAFVVQLDLAALPATDGIDIPHTGALYFFYAGMDVAAGFSPDDRGAWQVIYSDKPLADLPLRDLPDLEDELGLKAVRLAIEYVEPTFPGDEDVSLEALQLTPVEQNGYARFKAAWDESRPKPKTRLSGYPAWWGDKHEDWNASWDKDRPFGIHRVGGFPDYIQHDPKLEAHLVSRGLYCGDETGYIQGKDQGLYPGAAEWELLLQIDSEECAEICWGDAGRIHFLIHKEDLRQRNFEKTWLVFECH